MSASDTPASQTVSISLPPLAVVYQLLIVLCLSPGRLTMRPGVRVAQLMNIAFDMAAWEILGALANGAALVLRGSTRADWCAVLRSADVVIATPSILAQYDPREFGNVQCVAVAGEPCPQKVADTWAQSARFYDCCGPTEVCQHLLVFGSTGQ